MVNIHIATHTNLKNASRIQKITRSLSETELFEEIIIIGVADQDLPNKEDWGRNRTVYRVSLPKILQTLRKKLTKQPSTPSNPPPCPSVYLDPSPPPCPSVSTVSSLILIQLDNIYQYLLARQVKKICRPYKHAIINPRCYKQLPIAMKLKKQLKGKVIYDIHELESERINLSVSAKNRARRLEKKYLAKTEAIIVVSSEIRDWYIKQYTPIPIPLVVRNIPQNITRPGKVTPIFREKFSIPKDKIILLYNGGLTKARGIDLLLEVAAHSELSEKIVFVFMGFGALVPAIKAHTLFGTRMFYHEAVPMKDVPRYTAGADMGFSILYNSCLNHDYALPNKLFEYISAGIGVIGGITLTQKKIIDEYHIGLCASEEIPRTYVTLINSLTKEKINEYKKNSMKLRDSLSWENEVRPMIDLYKKLLP